MARRSRKLACAQPSNPLTHQGLLFPDEFGLCGYLDFSLRGCHGSPDQASRHQGKLSGPLRDRIDLHVKVSGLAVKELPGAAPGKSTAIIRQIARRGLPRSQRNARYRQRLKLVRVEQAGIRRFRHPSFGSFLRLPVL